MSPRLRIFVAAVLFSTGGAAIKYCGLTGWQVAGFRGAIAGTALLAMLPEARRHWSWRSLLVGCAYGATTVLFAVANKLTTAAGAIFLQSTSPVFVLLLAPRLVGERATRRDVGVMAVMAVGMALFFLGADRPSATATDPVTGNALALASAVTWAVTIIGYRWIGRGARDPEAAVASAAVAGNWLSFLVALPFAFPVGATHAADWAALVYLGVFQLALSYVFMARALAEVAALDVSLLLLSEPVISPVWAWLATREVPGAWSLAGGALILGAAWWKDRADRRAMPLVD